MMGRRGESGVTMVELVIVLAIIAVLAAAVYPMLGNVLQSTGSKGASEQVAAAVRLARQYAITRGQMHCIQFTGTPNTAYRIREASSVNACDSTLVIPPPGSSPDSKDVGHGLAIVSPSNLSIIFDGVGNVKNFAPGNPTVTLSVDTSPHSCEYRVLVTLYGGVRVTMGSC
jgi:prepilin-type N-terminal cleavage/methylation domain-containing protein